MDHIFLLLCITDNFYLILYIINFDLIEIFVFLQFMSLILGLSYISWKLFEPFEAYFQTLLDRTRAVFSKELTLHHYGCSAFGSTPPQLMYYENFSTLAGENT